MSSKQQVSRNYWLWVARKEYYFEESGDDRESLDPGA